MSKTMQILLRWDWWPGNVSELRTVLRRLLYRRLRTLGIDEYTLGL
jgi:transcriptional regulator of acetoin/glycerol metabolism